MTTAQGDTAMKKLMIYGATGYTGRMVAQQARDAGLRPVLAARDRARLDVLAKQWGLDCRAFSLNSVPDVERALSDVDVLVNCAGPFQRTASTLIPASIRCGTHYLDVSAELDSYRLCEALDEDAKQAGVMLLPGSGGSVAMLGSLVAVLIEQTRHPTHVAVALHVSGSMSRGSAISAAETLTPAYVVRRDGLLMEQPHADMRRFYFGRKQARCLPVTLPEVVTIWREHRVPDIETFVHVSGSAFPSGDLALLPDGPTAEERGKHRYRAAAVVTGEDGTSVRGFLDTVNGYSFTPLATVLAAHRVMAGAVKPGVQTPTGLFGARFAEDIADTRIVALASRKMSTHSFVLDRTA